MLSPNYKNGFIANYVISSWIVNLQIIYLASIFIYQNDWLNCYIILFFYCLFGQLPVKPKIPAWLSPTCMLLTTVCLYFNLPLLAATSVLFSHWLQGEQPIKPRMIGINILLIQSFLATFVTLALAHLLTIKTTFNPQRNIRYRIRFFKPLWILLFDQFFILAILTLAIWIYVISLPTLPPNDLIFSLLPGCVTAYLVNKKKQVIEPFLKPGYIGLSIGLACLAQWCNLSLLPHMEYWLMNPSYSHMTLLIFQQIVQATLIGSLLAAFNIQLTIYNTLSRKRHTEGFHFIYSMVNVMTIIFLSIWVTHQQDIYLVADWVLGLSILCMIITLCRYTASTLKATLKTAVQYAFRVEIHGLAHLEKASKPCVIIPNHNSYIEPPILAGMLPGRFMFPINPEAGKMLVVRLTEAFWEKLPMSPNKPMMLKPFIHGLRHGKSGIIFPEGQRSPIGKIGKIYPGAALSAKMTQSTLVPVIVDGSQYHVSSRMQTQFKKILFPKITIQIGKPVKVTKKTDVDESHIRQMMVHTQYLQQRPCHLKDAIESLIKQIGDQHNCLVRGKNRLSLRQVLKSAKKMQWEHQSFYHITETNNCPIRFLSALLYDIPIIYGDINCIESPKNAIYIVEDNHVTSFSMPEIMTMLYRWTYNSPIYANSNLFVADDQNDFRMTLFGFIGTLLNGTPCTMPTSISSISQDIYLEYANVLMVNETYFETLLNNTSAEEMSFIKHTIALKPPAAIREQWQNKFLHPIYAIDYSKDSLLTSFDTAYDTILTE